MFAVVIGLVLVLSVSVGIVLLVALPHLRHGSRILTPDGERKVKQAQTIATLGKPKRAGRNRGEDRRSPADGGPGPVIARPARPAGPVVPAESFADTVPAEPGEPEHVVTAYPHAAPAIGRQRPSPADSGPLPEVDEEPAIVAADEPTRPVRVIDVREAADTETPAGQA